jgi:hypothetical protein
MSEAHDFKGANVHASPPPGYEEMVEWLHCFHNGATIVSAWKPTTEELAELNAGGSIFVSVMSGSRKDGRPLIFPMFVGTEENVKEVVSDTGHVW